MLISRVPDESGGEGRGEEREREEAHHLQTANELFELMAKDEFEAAGTLGEDPLITRDLVLLYKNIDLGKQLMSNISGLTGNPSNQYVETVVYQDAHGSDTDLSECHSADDLDNIMVNNERIDLLTNNKPSNTLCHKFGDIEIKTSGFTADYDRHFSFKDPYIKEQLNNLKLMSASSELDSAVLPASLLDYICCKRLEDNYNFYMDNIIRYVKNTIEQLKRISNGDYLTEKAKEKWKEVANYKEGGDNASKVLTMSTSIPLHVERKLTGLSTTWDDLVHSEVDLRSLAKILEKRIVVEVPKLIRGSYKLFSKRRAENLVISCKRKETGASVVEPAPQSRVDVVFQLQRSESGEVVSNIDSIMILNSDLPTIKDGAEKLSLMYEEKEEPEEKKEKPEKTEEPITGTIQIIELNAHKNLDEICCPFSVSYDANESDSRRYRTMDTGEASCKVDLMSKEEQPVTARERQPRARSPRTSVSRLVRASAMNNLATPENMRFTLQVIDQPRVEESVEGSVAVKSKKKSPTRVRVKSPYENKSHVLEERKRKKLLEVREQRELKKMATADKMKGAKNPKYCKNAISPQASSSVTKLSITNKSFYNSIFGQNFNMESAKQVPIAVLNNAKGRLGQKKDSAYPEIVIEQPEEEGVGREEDQEKVPRELKYIDRSYYLDDAVTEMMYLEMKQGGAVNTSASTSAMSNDSRANVPHLSSPSLLNIAGPVVPYNSIRSEQLGSDSISERLKTSNSVLNVVTLNTGKGSSIPNTEGIDKTAAFSECRRSIDKIYTLMNKGGKIDHGQSMSKKSRMGLAVAPESAQTQQGAWPTGADSGMGFKNHPTSINLSFEKPAESLTNIPDSQPGRAVEPKVIISSKPRAKNDTCSKPDIEKPKKRAAVSPRSKTFSDNPLKAISQLLHEFDHVQKIRQKSVADAKPIKKEAGLAEERAARPEAARRRSRGEAGREGRERPAQAAPAVPRARPAPEPRGRTVAHRISDIIDEVKEARGEAVRGPIFSARLQALAQPRRSYVQAAGEVLRHARGEDLRNARGEVLRHARGEDLRHARGEDLRNARGEDLRHARGEDVRHARAQTLERVQRQAALGARSRTRRADPGTLLPEAPSAASSLERAAKARRTLSSSPDSRLSEARRSDVRVDPRAPVAETMPPNLKKKMVAVESYVKVYYGRGTAPGHAVRVPHIDNIELASTASSLVTEDSSAIGNKLQRMVESVLARGPAPAPAQRVLSPALAASPGPHAAPPSQRAPPPGQCSSPPGPRAVLPSQRAPPPGQCSPPPGPRVPPPPLPAVPPHSLHASPKLPCPSELPPLIPLSRIRREPSKESLDFTVDVFSDKEIVTAVATPTPSSQKLHTQLTELTQLTNETQHCPGTYNSIAELEMLENALYRKMSQSSFPKRLRIKNLTLTPKPSTQRIMVLQSGDSTSLVLKSKLSKIEINASKSTSNEIGYQTLSTTHVDWRFSQMPVQISTVGYSFPSYENSESNIIYQNNTGTDDLITEKLYNESDSENGSGQERDKVEMTCQYFKGSEEELGAESAVQDTDTNFSAPPAAAKTGTNDHLTGETAIATQLDPDVTPTEQNETQISSTINKEPSELVDYTQSLDILVGLLNEIQKITLSAVDDTTLARELDKTAPVQTRGTTVSTSGNTLRTPQLDITTHGTTLYPTLDETKIASELKEAAPANNTSKSAGTTTLVGTRDEATQDSRHVQPLPQSNLITLYEPKMVASSDLRFETEMESVVSKCVDKQVSAGLPRAPWRQHASVATEPPPRLRVLAPGLGALPAPGGGRSVLYSRPEIETSQVRLREIGTNPGTVKSLVLFHDNVVKDVKNVSVACKSFIKKAEGRKQKPSDNAVYNVDPDESGQAKRSLNKCVNATVSDPMVRVKRDILVTVYSLLVLTVFAALSLPEMLLHQA